MARWTLFARVVSLLCLICLSLCSTVKIETDIGTIIGSEIKVTVKNVEYTVRKFLGIPYAVPPVGERRFEKPEPMPAFQEPFHASAFGAACPQHDEPGMPSYNKKSEDCLFLNIYVPDQIPDRQTHGHPVMVLIHGGGFIMCAGETYAGENLAAFGNVIVVTLNYRLGVFGFMNTGDGKIRGNAGLFDQHLALKWVNQHIGSFGGDKDRVTIFGDSAGGSSVVFQGLYPANKGLVHRIISESGVATVDSIFMQDPKTNFLTLITDLGCDQDVDNAIACLKSTETNKIMDTLLEMTKVPEKEMASLYFPSVDGDFIKFIPSSLTKRSESERIEQVEFFRSLDVISGFNDKEGAAYLLAPVYPIEDLESFGIPREEFITKAAPTAIDIGAGEVNDAIKSVIIAEYTNWTDPDSPENNRDQYLKIIGDSVFIVPSIEISRLHTNITDRSQNSYAYFFTATPSTHAMKTPSWIKGANHGDEVAYVFLFADEIVSTYEKMNGHKFVVNEWEYELSYKMATYWTNFAKTGNPNQPRDVNMEWPKYDITEQRYINFDQTIVTGKYLYAREANLWLKTIPEMKKALSRDHDPTSPFVKKTDTDSCSADGECEGG